MLELKIGNFEENKEVIKYECGLWKFVVSKEDNAICLYAGKIPENLKYGHSNVVSQFNLVKSNILGGGDITYTDGALKFDGMSGDFGIVPNSAVYDFAKLIYNEFKDEYSIKDVKIDMHYNPETSENLEHIQMWKELGFEFDNNKRSYPEK